MTEKHRYGLEQWKILIHDQKESGMKVKDWCIANGYTKDAYYYWLRQIRKEVLPAALSQLNAPAVAQPFVDITPATTVPRSKYYPVTPSAVITKNGIEIGLFESASPQFIRLLLESVKNA